MSVFVLKIIALLSMLTDHISYVVTLAFGMDTPLLFNMRAVGRIAFPLYAFLLVNGFEKTRDKRAYMERLFLFALISQIPFSLAFTPANYSHSALSGVQLLLKSGWLWYIAGIAFALVILFFTLYEKKVQKGFFFILAALCAALLWAEAGGICLLGMQLNVFYTLAVSFAVMWALDIIISQRAVHPASRLVLIAAACAALSLCLLPQSDYGFRGLILIAALYAVRGNRFFQLLITASWAGWMYSYSNPLLIGALAACLPVALYNGKLGRKMKLGFYLAYPVHLIVLFLLVRFI